MTSQSIVRWFAPPEFARVDLKDRAHALWIVSWPFFIGVAVLLGAAALVEPDTLMRRATTIGAVGGLITILHATSRAGRPVLASWILVIGLPVIVTQRAWVTGGIHAPVGVFYVAFIVIAGTLLGGRGAFATAAACTLGAVLLAIATTLGWVTPKPGAGSAAGAFAFVLLVIGTALVLHALVAFRPRRPASDADATPSLAGDQRSRMTDSLLAASRIQAASMPVRRSIIDLTGLANDVVAAVREVEPARNIAVETSGNSTCNCDPNLTRRTLEILVNSAVEVTTIEGRVRVLVTGLGDRVSIAVTDEGPTVPANYRARILEPFGRMQHPVTDESHEFCKLAIEAQGGTIRVEDGVPRGNVFTLELRR